ncbi:nmrA-like family domain-containing protein 1 [Hyperolius riggenbachi]|uniref:nmrA-like family domain-containing protein 1 n=1 Tax=Hyperolius riggenbachi TaxID=752182 RepID=UPI0035A31D40
MAARKIITIIGATGAQGGSVASTLLKDSSFSVRAVTRDVSKPAAEKLRKAGAEVVAADIYDEKSLSAALNGAYGAFVVTNFFEHYSKEKEAAEGKRIADLCKKHGLKHVVFSGLENVHKLTGGKLQVQHFDGKGEAEEYFREIHVPMTSVRVAFYFDNFLTICKPQKSKDGKTYQLVIPMGNVPMDGISVADLGRVVLSIFENPSEYIGKDIGVSTEKLTIKQYAEIMSKVSGKTFVDSQITPEAYEKLGFRGAEELANMFRYLQTVPDRDVKLTHKLNPNTTNFLQFAESKKKDFQDL